MKTYLNCGKEPYLYYYRDKDAKEIDIVLEHDGVLNPIEIIQDQHLKYQQWGKLLWAFQHSPYAEPLLLVHFKSFRYSDGEQPFCL